MMPPFIHKFFRLQRATQTSYTFGPHNVGPKDPSPPVSRAGFISQPPRQISRAAGESRWSLSSGGTLPGAPSAALQRKKKDESCQKLLHDLAQIRKVMEVTFGHNRYASPCPVYFLSSPRNIDQIV